MDTKVDSQKLNRIKRGGGWSVISGWGRATSAVGANVYGKPKP